MKFNKSAPSQRVKLPSLSVRKVSTSGQIPLTRKPLKMKVGASRASKGTVRPRVRKSLSPKA